MRLHIFDMGGVLSQAADVIPLVAQHLGLTPARFSELAGPDLHEHSAGRIPERVFWDRFGGRWGHAVDEDLLGVFFQPALDNEVAKLIQGLKARGRVVCGTNTIASHYDIHVRRGDYAVFDAVYASHHIGYVKPDPEFHRHILRVEGVRPEETIFVDDLERNVEAARRLGIRSLVFTDAAELKRWLAN